jgi:hypothetical protein
MDIEQLAAFENAEQVIFVLRPDGESFVVKGKKPAVKEVLALIEGQGDEVLALLRIREGFGEEEIERIIAPKIRSLAEQKQAYIQWILSQSEYYQPSPEALERMWSALEEWDEVYFDFALSITARRIRGGELVAIDCHGRDNPVSPYSPALAQQEK